MKKKTRRPRGDFEESTARPEARSRIYEVAKQAGVSVVTVSRVFNDHQHVSPAMRARVLDAARAVSYQPRVVTKRNLLAVVVGGLDYLSAGDQTSQVLLELVRTAAARDYLIEFLPLPALLMATQNLVDGLIMVGLSSHELASLRDLPPVPRVILNNGAPDEGWSTACVDPISEVQVGLHHLLEHQHRDIALVLDNARGWQTEQREVAYHHEMQKAGLRSGAVIRSSLFQDSRELAQAVKDSRCTACLCLCNCYGLPVLNSLQNELGLSIPRDISLITAEHSRVSPFLKPRLTTVSQPLREMAGEAMAALVLQAEDPEQKPFAISFKSQLISRDSVQRLA